MGTVGMRCDKSPRPIGLSLSLRWPRQRDPVENLADKKVSLNGRHRARYILEGLLAQIDEDFLYSVANLLVGCAGQTEAARLADAFGGEPGVG